jgi:sugar lactone lactonase YvrE
LLAPRGVAVCDHILAVSDTGQNRVFIWKNFSTLENREPDIVLGQDDFSGTGRNTGAEVGAGSLQYPSGIWTDGKKLIVADAWNHRVLIWHSMPTENGQPADVVLGQKNFESNLPNVEGLNKAPSARSLYWCYGIASNGKSLWVADTGNRRVLFYEKIPTENFAAADKVIGQNNFEERNYDNNNAIWPYSVKLSDDGALAITDTQYYRVLIWKNNEDAFTQKADIILGQKDFESNGMNQYRLAPAANTLNWVYDSCFYKNGIFVTDTGNSRILRWKNIPEMSNANADELFGQPTFETNGESSLSLKTHIESEMYWAFAITTYEQQLIVADTGNHRILFYNI